MTSDLVTRYLFRSPQENVSECGKRILESSPDLSCFRSSAKPSKQNNDIKETIFLSAHKLAFKRKGGRIVIKNWSPKIILVMIMPLMLRENVKESKRNKGWVLLG